LFLKPINHHKHGRRHTYWALVESYRTARGSRHRVVAYLGRLRRGQQSGWSQLAATLDGRMPPQPLLFGEADQDEADEELRLVRLKGIKLERVRDFGNVYLALALWRMLGLDTLLDRLMPAGREEVPWPAVAAILAIARLCEPASELHIQDRWYPNTALDDLLGVGGEQVNIGRLYTCLDRLLPHKPAIEQHLKDRLGVLFGLKYDLLLYDLTSTYFEGQCPSNPMAKRGYSRDHRGDCLQVVIALVVTDQGMPIGYEVFDGNQNDSKTVQQMVTAMEERHGKAQRVWVFDRGCVSEANLSFLRARGGQYLVGTPRSMLKRFEQHLTEQGWQEVQAGVDVKLVPGPEGDETFVLARSKDRIEKEKAMHQRFVRRMQDGLNKLAAAADSGRLRDAEKAGRRLGRLQAQNTRASAAFTVTITPLPPAPRKKQKTQPALSITWKREERWDQWAALSEGCYLLRTNLNETDPRVLWKQYTQLTDAEWAFRINKDELRIRPIWHQRSDRVRGHILVCFLAYAMWKTLGGWMSKSGLGEAPRPVLEQMKAIKSGDVVLPTARADGTRGDTLRLRCVTTPNDHQEVLLNRLGLMMPERIRTLQDAEALLA
jgi:hypothetical protein